MMEKIKTIFLGYGEDALTLWAITERLDLILDELGDDSDPADCTVFYRPSFGRAGLYGEFDAIIVTPMMAYLVESKWDRTGGTSIKLEEHQIRRHEILEWYHDNWKGEEGEEWDVFARLNNPSFKAKFTYFVNEKEMFKYIPYSTDKSGEPTILTQNLQTILKEIRGKKLENVLIFFHRGRLPEIEKKFKIVKIEYETKLGNYIELLST